MFPPMRRLLKLAVGSVEPAYRVSIVCKTPAGRIREWGFVHVGCFSELIDGEHMPKIGSRVFLLNHGWSKVLRWDVRPAYQNVWVPPVWWPGRVAGRRQKPQLATALRQEV